MTPNDLPDTLPDAGSGQDSGRGTLMRMASILRAFAEAPGDLTIKELTRHLSLPPSTVHRQLAILSETGFVRRNPRSRSYSIGPEFARLAALVSARRSLRTLARPFMQAVVDQVGEACVLIEAVEEQAQVAATALINSANPLRYDLAINVMHSILWGATGKSVLAFLPRADQELLYRMGGTSPSGKPLPPLGEFLATLDGIRAQGYALTFSEKIPGAVGMGAPIVGPAGRAVGSLCITIPEVRFQPANAGTYSAVLREKAAALGREIGGGGVEALR